MSKTHMDFLEKVAESDVALLRKKEQCYKGSWKKRGGVGAFMMLARKWDRIEAAVEQDKGMAAVLPENRHVASKYDVFAHIEKDDRKEGENLLADIQDLRCYLMLVEAEVRARHAGE